MPTQKQYTYEEAVAYLAERGIDMSPEIEADLRRQGKLVGPTRGPLGTAPARERDPRFASPDAVPVNPLNVPKGEINRDSLGMQLFEGLSQAALPFAALPPTAGEADTVAEKVARGVGLGAGFALPFGAIGKATAPLGRAVGMGFQATKYAPLARVAANATQGALGLGTYSAMHPGTPMERIENFASGANMGAGFGLAGGLPGVGAALRSPVGKYPANAALMAGVEAAHGGDPVQGAAMGAAMPLFHSRLPEAEPQRLARTPAERETEFVHGTSSKNAESIMRDGFNIDPQRESGGGYNYLEYGDGIYIGREGSHWLEDNSAAARSANYETSVPVRLRRDSRIKRVAGDQGWESLAREVGYGSGRELRDALWVDKDVPETRLSADRAIGKIKEKWDAIEVVDPKDPGMDQVVVYNVSAIESPRGLGPRPSETPDLDPIEGEPRSVPVSRYLKGEISVDEMARQYGEMDLREPSEQVTKHAESGLSQNIGANQSVGPHRRIREMGGNAPNNPLSKASIRQFELWDRAKHQMEADLRADFRKALEAGGFKEGGSAKEYAALREYMKNFPGERAGEESLAVLAAEEFGRMEALAKSENPEAIKAAAPKIRAELERQHALMDNMARAVGGEFPYRRAYYPNIKKVAGWSKPIEALKQSVQPIAPKSLEPTRSPEAWTPRKLPQAGLGESYELDPFKFMDRVIRDVGRATAQTGAISAGMSAASAYEKAGLNRTAQGLRAITDARYNKKRYGIAGAFDQALETNPYGKAFVNYERWQKQRFNVAKYTLAVPFIVLRQWGSLALLNAHGEITPAMWAKALALSTLPASGVKYRNSYTGWVKNLDYGHLSKEGAEGDVTSQGSIRQKKGLEKLPDALRAGSEKAVNLNENWTGRVSVEMADLIFDKLLAKGKVQEADRAALRSEIAGFTQSYYDAMNRAEVLNSPTLNLLVPAQSFGLESFNSMARDVVMNKTITKGQKAFRIGQLLTLVYMQQLLNQFVTSYKSDTKDKMIDAAKGTATVSVPYVPQILGVAGFGDGKLYLATLIDEMVEAAGHLGEKEWMAAFSGFAKNYLRGGAQMSRTIETDIRIERGDVDESDRLWGSLFGWYIPESGKEYMRDVMNYDDEESEARFGPRPPARGRRGGGQRRGR